MKKIIKNILNFKGRIINRDAYISFSSKIKGYKNIHMDNDSWIGKNVEINTIRGKIRIGNNSYINNKCNINVIDGEFIIGKNSFLNEECKVIVLGNIIIGNDVMIANNCFFVSGNHKFNNLKKNINQQGFSKQNIVIKNNVWIGLNSIILGNVTIEEGAIIGAGSVVTKNVGKNEIWAGNPAKFIKRR